MLDQGKKQVASWNYHVVNEQRQGQKSIYSTNVYQKFPNKRCLELDREYYSSLLYTVKWNAAGKLLWGVRISSALREIAHEESRNLTIDLSTQYLIGPLFINGITRQMRHCHITTHHLAKIE